MRIDPWFIGACIFSVVAIFGAIVVARRVIRNRRRQRPAWRIEMKGAKEAQQVLTKTAEALARTQAQAQARADMLRPAGGGCTCGARPEGVVRNGQLLRRYHSRSCPEWTKEGADEFVKQWRTRIGKYDASVTGGPALRGGKISFDDPTTGRRESVSFEEGDTAEEVAARLSDALQPPLVIRVRSAGPPPIEFDWEEAAELEPTAKGMPEPNPAPADADAERFARLAEIVSPALVPADPAPFQGGGGEFGGGGATASYDPPAADPAPACEPSPSYDSAPACDSGSYSGGGDS